VWEEIGLPGENRRGRAGDDLMFSHTTQENESGQQRREASAVPLRYTDRTFLLAML